MYPSDYIFILLRYKLTENVTLAELKSVHNIYHFCKLSWTSTFAINFKPLQISGCIVKWSLFSEKIHDDFAYLPVSMKYQYLNFALEHIMASLFSVVSYPQAFRHLWFPLYIPAAYHWLSYDLAKMADECIKTANAVTAVDDSIEGVPLVALRWKKLFTTMVTKSTWA